MANNERLTKRVKNMEEWIADKEVLIETEDMMKKKEEKDMSFKQQELKL